MPVINRVAEMQDQVAEWRRYLHENPELQYDVFNTSSFVADKLRAFGCDVVEVVLRLSVETLGDDWCTVVLRRTDTLGSSTTCFDLERTATFDEGLRLFTATRFLVAALRLIVTLGSSTSCRTVVRLRTDTLSWRDSTFTAAPPRCSVVVLDRVVLEP